MFCFLRRQTQSRNFILNINTTLPASFQELILFYYNAIKFLFYFYTSYFRSSAGLSSWCKQRIWRRHPSLLCWTLGYEQPDVDTFTRMRSGIRIHMWLLMSQNATCDKQIKWFVNKISWEFTSEGRGSPPGTPRSCWCQFSPRCRTAGRAAGRQEPGPSRSLVS